MAELDVERLKQLDRSWPETELEQELLALIPTMIAIREDRDRLRLLGAHLVSTAVLVPMEDDETAEAWVVHPQALDELRAALESSDG